MTACADQWEPPTPRSHLVPLPEPTLPVNHLVLLPPPMLPSAETVARLAERVSQSVANHVGTQDDEQRSRVSQWSAGSGHPQQGQSDPQDLEWFPVEPAPKRPRRSAAIVAARNIPRQPSPFDLTEEGFEDDGGDEPDPSESMSPPPTSSSRGGGASKRKVSHSLIERRRREKINDCLAALRETVPNLREEGERKLARAKERGRKRGRGDDAGERGGLHKLEILQGTIAYIEDLRARIDALEHQPASPASPPSPTSAQKQPSKRPPELAPLDVAPSAISPLPPFSASLGEPLNSMRRSTSLSLASSSGSGSGSGEVDDHEASLLLLNFSTSPELRPMF
ncbi:hypothetical protein BMF94_6787 [Rhodotorula taiwanensis]|uniref:BHLH domain-containing protein n=1 Tax=Rhodotorula taiwanensis TaxID=741276 RepID=A0A2S5B093_9BASI|nr:hypothetical protein BMF94_6787 [Rhodotorula taiwanensis]